MHALNTRTEKSKSLPLHRKKGNPNKIHIQISRTVHCPAPVKWVEKLGDSVLREEMWQGNGILSIVFVSDSEIESLNLGFLGRARPTDVIAFPLADEEDEIWGEIYISVDRTREQADEYHVPFEEELARLVIHGILHLLGFKDHTSSERKKMTDKEDLYLARFWKSHRPERRIK